MSNDISLLTYNWYKKLQGNHNHPLVYMRGVTLIQLKSVIELINFGETQVKDDECERILKLIKELELHGGKEVVKKKEAETKSIKNNFWNKGYSIEEDSCSFAHYHEHLQSGRCG